MRVFLLKPIVRLLASIRRPLNANSETLFRTIWLNLVTVTEKLSTTKIYQTINPPINVSLIYFKLKLSLMRLFVCFIGAYIIENRLMRIFSPACCFHWKEWWYSFRRLYLSRRFRHYNALVPSISRRHQYWMGSWFLLQRWFLRLRRNVSTNGLQTFATWIWWMGRHGQYAYISNSDWIRRSWKE